MVGANTEPNLTNLAKLILSLTGLQSLELGLNSNYKVGNRQTLNVWNKPTVEGVQRWSVKP